MRNGSGTASSTHLCGLVFQKKWGDFFFFFPNSRFKSKLKETHKVAAEGVPILKKK